MKNKLQKNLQEQMEQDALLREVVEDVKSEELQRFWNKYGLWIITGIALILTFTVSFETLKSWHQHKQQEISNAYSAAMSLQNQGRLDESLEIYTTMAKKSGGIYGDLARLQIATIYLDQNKKEDAYAVLQKLVADRGVNTQLRHISALKLASYKLNDNAPSEEITALLQPVINSEEGSDVARELEAMLHLRNQDYAAAKSEYEQIANSANAQDSLKARAQDMLNLLNEQN